MKGPGAALLADGSSVVVREVTGSDRDALLQLHAAASDTSLYLRLFSLTGRQLTRSSARSASRR